MCRSEVSSQGVSATNTLFQHIVSFEPNIVEAAKQALVVLEGYAFELTDPPKKYVQTIWVFMWKEHEFRNQRNV